MLQQASSLNDSVQTLEQDTKRRSVLANALPNVFSAFDSQEEDSSEVQNVVVKQLLYVDNTVQVTKTSPNSYVNDDSMRTFELQESINEDKLSPQTLNQDKKLLKVVDYTKQATYFVDRIQKENEESVEMHSKMQLEHEQKMRNMQTRRVKTRQPSTAAMTIKQPSLKFDQSSKAIIPQIFDYPELKPPILAPKSVKQPPNKKPTARAKSARFGRNIKHSSTVKNLHELCNTKWWIEQKQEMTTMQDRIQSSKVIQSDLASKYRLSMTRPLSFAATEADHLSIAQKDIQQSSMMEEKGKEEKESEQEQVSTWIPQQMTSNQNIEQSIIRDMVALFNSKNEQFKSFTLKSQVLLVKMAGMTHLVEGKPPYFFQTVLASSILHRMVKESLQKYASVLTPVCNYLFKAIYMNFKEVDPDQDKFSSLPFSDLNVYFEDRKQLTEFKIDATKKIRRYEKIEIDLEQLRNVNEQLIVNLQKFFEKRKLRSIMIQFRKISQENKLGWSGHQRREVFKKQKVYEKRRLQRYHFNNWLLYSQLKKVKSYKTLVSMDENKIKDSQQRENSMNNHLKIANLEIERLKRELQKKDELLKVKNEELSQLRSELNTKIPKNVGQSIEIFLQYFSATPDVNRIQVHNHLQIKHLKSTQGFNLIQLNQELAPKEVLKRRSGIRPRLTQKFTMRPSTGQKLSVEISKKLQDVVLQSPVKTTNQNSKWFVQHLLRQSERVDQGGIGSKILLSCSLEDILFRWGFFMIEKACSKLRPIIELLEEQLGKHQGALTKRYGRELFLQENQWQDKPGEQEFEKNQKTTSEVPFYLLPNSILTKDNLVRKIHLYMEETIEGQELTVVSAKRLHQNLVQFYQDLKRYYIEFQRQRLLFLEDMTGGIEVNLAYMLVAIIFSLDENYKVVRLMENDSDNIWTEVTSVKAVTNVNPDENTIQAQEILLEMYKNQFTSALPSRRYTGRVFQIPDITILRQFMGLDMKLFEQEYNPAEQYQQKQKLDQARTKKNLLRGRMSRMTTSPNLDQQQAEAEPIALNEKQIKNQGKQQQAMRSIDSIKQALKNAREKERADYSLKQFVFIRKTLEKMTQAKLEWFISAVELMGSQAKAEVGCYSLRSTQSSSMTFLLAFVFMYRSRLDQPYIYSKFVEQKGEEIISKVKSDYKKSKYKQDIIEDQSLSDPTHDMIMQSILQVVQPIIYRTTHSNIQDVMLLFNFEDIIASKKARGENYQKGTTISDLKLLNITQRPVLEIKLRWLNFILEKAFSDMCRREEQASDFMARIKQEQSAQNLSTVSESQAKQIVQANTINRDTHSDSQNLDLRITRNQTAPELTGQARQSVMIHKSGHNQTFKNLRSNSMSSQTSDKESIKKSKSMLKVLDFQPVINIENLTKNNFNNLIVLLVTLSPESVWQFFRLDSVPIDHELDIMLLGVSLLEPKNSTCAQVFDLKLKMMTDNLKKNSSDPVKGNLSDIYKKTNSSKENRDVRGNKQKTFIKDVLKQQHLQNSSIEATMSRANDLFSQGPQSLSHEFRYLFIIDAINRITGKNYLLSFDQLVKNSLTKQMLYDIVTELFIARPQLNTVGFSHAGQLKEQMKIIEEFMREQNMFIKGSFDKLKLDSLEAQTKALRNQRAEVIRAFNYCRDCEKIYSKLCRNFREDQSKAPSNMVQMASKHGLIRSNEYLCRLETQLSQIDLHLVKHMIKFQNHRHAAAWCNKIVEVVNTFKFPIRRFMNFLSNDDCQVSYLAIWRLIKQVNITGLNPINKKDFQLKNNKIEKMLSKVAEFIQKRHDPFGIRERECEIPYDQQMNIFDSNLKPPNLSKIEEKKSPSKAIKMPQTRRKFTQKMKLNRAMQKSQSITIIKETISQKSVSNIKESKSEEREKRIPDLNMGMGYSKTFQENLLRRVSVKSGIHTPNVAIKIKSSLLPENVEQQKILLERRLLYDLNLTVKEAMAVFLIFIFELQFKEIMEFFLGGAPVQKSGHTEQEILLLVKDKEYGHVAHNPQTVNDFNKQYELQRFTIEQTTDQTLHVIKSNLSYKHGSLKGQKLIEIVQDSIIGDTERQCPECFFSLLLVKSMLTRDNSMLNTRQRHAVMMRNPVQELINFYKPMIASLFEYYLYESYPSDAITQLHESCLPLVAIENFYAEFASGESSRFNKSTFQEMFTRIVGMDPETLPKQQQNKDKGCKSSWLDGLGDREQRTFPKGIVPFNDFLEMIFDISQEINVNRNITVAEKFKEYMESKLMQGIRYRLLRVRRDLTNEQEESIAHNAQHKLRLHNELDRIRMSEKSRQKEKGFEGGFIDLI